MESVKVHFSRTLQVVRFEPCSFGVEYATEVRPGETAESAHRRAQDTLATMFNEVQNDVIRQFGLQRQVELSSTTTPPPPPKKNK